MYKKTKATFFSSTNEFIVTKWVGQNTKTKLAFNVNIYIKVY